VAADTCACWSTEERCEPCRDTLWGALRGVVAVRGERWADEIAARRREAWTPWPRDSARVHAAAIEKVADLTRDRVLRDRFATELECWAARRWENYRPLAMLAQRRDADLSLRNR